MLNTLSYGDVQLLRQVCLHTQPLQCWLFALKYHSNSGANVSHTKGLCIPVPCVCAR